MSVNEIPQILWLYGFSKAHRSFNIYDVNRCIIPPIMFSQYITLYDEDKIVGFASWGFISQEKAGMFLDGEYELAPEDWRSGDVLIFMDFIAPFGHTIKLTRALRNLFPDTTKAEWRRHTQNKRVGVNIRV